MERSVFKNVPAWILSIIALSLLFLIVWKIPIYQTRNIQPPESKIQFELENDARSTLVSSLGGLFFFVTSFFTWRNLRNSERNFLISEDKQITERFINAVKMLADKEPQIRLGGIYSLERISRDSVQDYPAIIEILTVYIRKSKPQGVSISEDIQAALTVIGRRENREIDHLNLSKAQIPGADINGNFNFANLRDANLKGASLYGTTLDYADLSGANLEDAKLGLTSLNAAILDGITWNEETQWPNKEELMKAKNLPHNLYEYLRQKA